MPTNIFGYAQKPEGNTALVSYVAPGSDAYKHGLLQGDRILAAQSGPDGMALIVERNKSATPALFNTRKPELAADSPALKGKVLNAAGFARLPAGCVGRSLCLNAHHRLPW
ncbi:MAG: hypothetical protein IPI39_19175 [Candidatus Obscuribacter sp.]|nr:hypothetical protein [Candidatus Obscuribacter sp.]